MEYHDLDEEFLDKIWCRWNEKSYGRPKFYLNRYRSVHRRDGSAQRFEAWLFKQGGMIKQKDKARFIRFFNEDNLLLFILENS